MKDKHIGLRLGMAFALLIAILLGVGQLGLRRMQEIDKTLGDITVRRSANLDLARRALMLSNINGRIDMEVVLVGNRALVETLLATRSENGKEITRLMEESEKRCQSEEERALLDAVKETRKPYVDSYLRAVHLLVDEKKHDEAEAVMVNEAMPALLKYHAAWDEFVEFQKNEVKGAVEQAQVEHAKARRLASLLIALAVFIAVVIAIFATRETAREISARIAAKNEVSNLNATLEARVMQRTHDLSEASKHVDLQSAALEAAANAIVITDFHGTVQWVNHAFTTLTGYSAEEVLGKNPRLLKSGKQPQRFYADLWSTVSSGRVWHGELINRRKDEGEQFYRALATAGAKVRVGMEASGHAGWFERLLAEVNFELWMGDAAKIVANRVRKQKTDRLDAQHILTLMVKDDFPKIWVPSWENRDLRQLLWHRHRMVQTRTRITNHLQAAALNEGLRHKKKLWRESGRQQLESLPLAPWASRRRHDLLEVLDRINPTIAELTQAIEQEAKKCLEAQRLMTHLGVGALTALVRTRTAWKSS